MPVKILRMSEGCGIVQVSEDIGASVSQSVLQTKMIEVHYVESAAVFSCRC